MKKKTCFPGAIILAVFSLFFYVSPVFSGEKATKEECINMSKEVIATIEKEGLDAVISKINDRNGPFMWKDSYVCLLDTKEAKFLAHPYLPRNRIGVSMIHVQDAFGKQIFREILNLANSKGQGWVEYIHMDHKACRAREKISYVIKSEKADVIALAGLYTGKVVEAPQYEFPEMPLPDIQGKKVALIIANKGFSDSEFRVPKKMIERAGGKTEVFSLVKGVAHGMYSLTVDVRYTLDDLRISEFDAVIFVGGIGSNVYHKNPKAHQIAREAVKQDKILAAICWAPVILANAKVIDGKMATVTPLERSRFQNEACFYTGDQVTVDGRIITANGPEASAFFAKAVIESLNH